MTIPSPHRIHPNRRQLLAGIAALSAAPAGLRAEDEQPPPPREEERRPPQRLDLMLCGDSLAQGLYLSLLPVMRRREAIRVINGTQHATGITRSDEYDWPTVAKTLVARHQPNLVVFWIGANDFRPLVLREQRARYAFGTRDFAEHYGQRVADMATAATKAGSRAVWLGLPNMRNSQFASAALVLNEVQEKAATASGAIFVPTWASTSTNEGVFMASVEQDHAQKPLRAEDGVHFTDLGYRRIAALAFEQAVRGYPDLARFLSPTTAG